MIAILFFVHFWMNAVAFSVFFQNLLGSNVYSWSTKLLQISHIIVSIFSGVIIVTVNIKKNGGRIEFEGQIKVISFQ